MNRLDYNRYCHWRSQQGDDMAYDMPYLAGGYTQADWDILNGELVDWEYYYDECDTPSSKYEYLTWWTKPYWA